MQSIEIDGRLIGPGEKCFIIAEVGQAHCGNFKRACDYITAASEAGADAVKFQTHLAQAESTLDEPFRTEMGSSDSTRFDYWKRMEFSKTQWRELSAMAHNSNLVFLSSAFSVEAVEILADLGMSAWKVGSGEFRSFELIDAMCEAGGPILLSTGMSRFREIDDMVDCLREKETFFGLFQCTSSYPSSLREIGLNVIKEYDRRYNCPTGLSDHSGCVYPSIAAMAQGADMVEVHIVIDRSDKSNPDRFASLTPMEIHELAKARDAFYTMEESPVDKDATAKKLEVMRGLFTKSIAPACNLPAGTVLNGDMLVPRKPGTGIPFTEKHKLIGRTLKREVSPRHLLTWEDMDE